MFFCMKEPEVICKRVHIDNSNLADFFAAQPSAFYNMYKNQIILYDYTISDDLKYPDAVRARKIVKLLQKERPCSLEHETQHWRNVKNAGDPALVANGNYYQEVALAYLDEMSAFTAQNYYYDRQINCLGPCAETITAALYFGISEFAYGAGMTFYLRDILQKMRENILYDLKKGYTDIATLQKLQERMRKNPAGLFNKRFRGAVRHYFTFDGYCIMDDKVYGEAKEICRSIKKIHKTIKNKYMQQTQKLIDEIIANHTRKKTK